MASRTPQPEIIVCTTAEFPSLAHMRTSRDYQYLSFPSDQGLGTESHLEMHVVHPVPVDYLVVLADSELQSLDAAITSICIKATGDTTEYENANEVLPRFEAMNKTLARLSRIKRERAERYLPQKRTMRDHSHGQVQEFREQLSPRIQLRPSEDWGSERPRPNFTGHAQHHRFPQTTLHPFPEPWLPSPHRPGFHPPMFQAPGVNTFSPWHQHHNFQSWTPPNVFTAAPAGAFYNPRVPQAHARPQSQVHDDRMMESSSSNEETTNKPKKPHKPHNKRHQRKKRHHSSKHGTPSQPEIWDPYIRLGILRTATNDEIIAARRSLAVRYHPDRLVNQSTEEKDRGQVRFQEISEAFAIVGDRWMRAAYDQEGRTSNLEDLAGRLRKAHERMGR